MNLGAERKKLYFLGGLGLLAAYSIYTNVLTEPEIPASARESAAKTKAAAGAAQRPSVQGLPQAPTAAQQQVEDRNAQRKKAFAGREAVGEYRATLKYARPEDRPDPMKVDPTLRLDLLAKLQKVVLEGGQRSLFEFSTAPPPKAVASGKDPKIQIGQRGKPGSTDVADATPSGVKLPEVKPPPPPIPLKFYGFTTPKSGGVKRAFFLEGEDIYVAAEGETIKRRYKIVRVGVSSAVVEDTENKNQQTLPLEEPPVSG